MKSLLMIICFCTTIVAVNPTEPQNAEKNWGYLSLGVSPLYLQSFTLTGKYWYDKHQTTDFGLIANTTFLHAFEMTPRRNPNYNYKDNDPFTSNRIGLGLGPYWAWRAGDFIFTSALIYEFYIFNFEFNGKALFEVEYDIFPEILIGVATSYVFQGGPKRKIDSINPYYYPYSDFNVELKIAMTFEKSNFGHEIAHKSIFGIPLVAGTLACFLRHISYTFRRRGINFLHFESDLFVRACFIDILLT